MKKVYLLAVLVFAFLISCGGGNDQVTVKPEKTKISGPLKDYIEVEDGEYSISEKGLSSGKLMVKFKNRSKANDAIFNSSIDLTITILNEKGMPISGIETFRLESSSQEKLISLLNDDSDSEFLTFESLMGFDKDKYGKEVALFSVSSTVKDFDSEEDMSESDETYYPDQMNPLAELSDNYNLDQEELGMMTLQNYNKETLRIMRNWIFARHGYKFKSKDLQDYFGQFSWYEPKYSDVTKYLNSTEKENIETLKEAEKFAKENHGYSSSNDDDDDDSYSSKPKPSCSSSDWDALLDDYEEYIDAYIKLLKKAQNNDMSSMTEALKFQQSAVKLQERFENAGEDDMTSKQLERYGKLMAKLVKEAAKLQNNQNFNFGQ